MEVKKKKNIVLVLSLLLWLGAAVLHKNLLSAASKQSETVTAQPIQSEKKQPQKHAEDLPTLFIHGYRGTKDTFTPLLARLKTEQYLKKDTLLLTVGASGKVTAQEDAPKTFSAIQLVFEDNTNTEFFQAEYLKNALLFLQETYNVKRLQVVGHSMGGVCVLRYLLTYGALQTYPSIEKVVAVGSPFNSFVTPVEYTDQAAVVTKAPAIKSSRYLDYEKKLGQIPKKTRFLCIAGDLNDGSKGDGVVSVTDAFSLVHLLRTHQLSTETAFFEGQQAEHSALLMHPEAVQTMATFLWETK